MLDSVGAFDASTRIRELELSIARRLREALRQHISDPQSLENATREMLAISRDFAGSFQAINNRARIRREREAE